MMTADELTKSHHIRIGQQMGGDPDLAGVVLCMRTGKASRWFPPLPPEELPIDEFKKL